MLFYNKRENLFFGLNENVLSGWLQVEKDFKH